MVASLRKLKIFSRRSLQRILLAFLVLILPVFAFVGLADEVREGEPLPFDNSTLQAINALSSPQLDTVAVVSTQLGGTIGVIVLTVGIGLLLWGRRLRQMAALLVVGVSGSMVLNLLLKAFFQRDRPQLWERLVTENSYSFPSGHAMASSALALSMVVVFWPTRWRWLVVIGAAAYMITIGLSRLYLGVHYPSDVLAGWAVSAAWIATMVYALTYRVTFTKFLSRRRT